MEKVRAKLSKIKENQAKIRREIKIKTIGYILAAFGFVASLAWNEAIKSFIDQFFPTSSNSVLIKFIYALVVTVILVLVTIYFIKQDDNKDKNNG